MTTAVSWGELGDRRSDDRDDCPGIDAGGLRQVCDLLYNLRAICVARAAATSAVVQEAPANGLHWPCVKRFAGT